MKVLERFEGATKRNLISMNQRLTRVNVSFTRLVRMSRCGRWVLCVCVVVCECVFPVTFNLKGKQLYPH